jgi:type IV pilus assembly protein PilN
VRLISLRLPYVAAENAGGRNHVQLDMTVGSEQPQAVLELFKRMQGSGLFGAPYIVSQDAPTQNEPLFRYRMSVPYVQKF